MRQEKQLWKSIRATADLVYGGVPDTGKSPTVVIQRVSDSKYFNGTTWVSSSVQLNMTEVSATDMPGLYQYSILESVLETAGVSAGEAGYFMKIEESTNTFLEYIFVSVDSPEDVADYVWDESSSAHNTAGTFGYAVNNISVDEDVIAAAVWDSLEADHQTSGTFGFVMQVCAGLAKRNFEIRNGIYDGDGRMLSCEMVVYPSAAAALAGTPTLTVIDVSADYDSLTGNMETFVSVEE